VLRQTMGSFSRTASPGLNVYFWPFQEVVGILSTRVQQLNVRTVTKTQDNVTVTVQVAVQYRMINDKIKDDPPVSAGEGGAVPFDADMARDECESNGVWRAYYRLTDIEQQLRPYVEDVVRSEVPKKSLDSAYAEKDNIAIAVRQSLSHEMKQYGYGAWRPDPTDAAVSVAPDGRTDTRGAHALLACPQLSATLPSLFPRVL
jgi:regulator of protease activity HflC (stomatin/prohibitin superfamily)